jgi:voltage-gated potassium channel
MTAGAATPSRGAAEAVQQRLRRERTVLLGRVIQAFEPVMVALSAAWIALLIAELVNRGLPRSLEILVWAIWGLFILDFLLKLVIAPAKLAFLRAQWLTVLSLLLPAIRFLRVAAMFRVLRAARVTRSVGLLRLATTVNRGLATLARTASRRGAGYVAAATGIVICVGAAGMAFFESPASLAEAGLSVAGDAGLADYGEALWWTAYTMTTGATEAPRTSEGRLLGWLLSVYGLAVFGYLTAILASHFIGQDGSSPGAEGSEAGAVASAPARTSGSAEGRAGSPKRTP